MSIFSDFTSFVSSAANTISQGLNVAEDVAEIAFPETAIASSLGNMLAGGLGSAITQGLGMLTQGGGLPSFIAKEAGDLVNQVVGQFTQPSNSSCDQQMQGIWSPMQQALDQFKQTFADNCTHGSNGTKHGAKSWFEALAQALGSALDKQADNLTNAANAVTNAAANGTLGGTQGGSSGSNNPSELTNLQTQSQLFGMMMSTVEDVIKTIGEKLTSMAGKN